MNKKMTRSFSILLALLMAASMLTGCISNYASTPAETKPETTAAPSKEEGSTAAGEESTPAETPAPSIAGTKLEVWYAVSGTSGEKFTALSDAFAKESGVVLEMSYSGGSADTATKVSAALLNNTQPDVALMYAGPLYTGGRGDFSVDELMNGGDFDKADIFEGMLDYCVYKGEGICAVPYGISTQVLYYNKAILAAAGVDMTNPPKTWQEFKDVCKSVLEKGNINKVEDFAAFDTTDEAWLFKSMLMQNGCEIVTNDNGNITPIFNNEKAVEVADFWKSLVDDGIMLPGEHNNAENKFLAGNLGFVAASSNRISKWAGNTDFELGAIEMPYFTQPSLALGGNVLVILTSDPEKVAAAWQYVSYLANVENNTDFALTTGYLPIHKSALELDSIKKAIEENEMYQVAFNQLSYTWAYTHFEAMGTMDSQLNGALGKLEKGKGTSQDLLDKAVKYVAKEIAEG